MNSFKDNAYDSTTIMQSIVSNFLQQRQATTATVATTSIIAATILLYSFNRLSRNKRDDSTPCIPHRFPFIGSTLEYLADTEAFAKKYSDLYGPVFKAHLFGKVVIVVGGQYAEEVFTNPDMSFIASNNKFINVNSALDTNSYELTTNDLRHLILKHLKDNIDVYLARVQKETMQVLKSKLGDHSSVTLAGLYPLARALTANATGTVFGGPSMLSNDTLMEHFEYTADETLKDVIRAAPYTMFWPGLSYLYRCILQPKFGSIKRHLKVIKRAVRPEVEHRLQALRKNGTLNEEQDVMNYIIETYLHDQEDTIVVNSISNWFVVMSFLSVLTTSGALGNVLEYLAKYPEYVAELLEEQNNIIPQDQMGVTSAEQKKLIKLDSFIREVFRITTKNFGHAHTHIGKQDIVLSNGTVVHPGDEVYINLWHVNFDPKIQRGVEDVDTFKPFRYVDQDKPAVRCSPDYLAFGLGRHACPGRWFAIDIIKTIISILIRHYELSLAPEDDKTGTPDDLEKEARRVIVKPRTST